MKKAKEKTKKTTATRGKKAITEVIENKVADAQPQLKDIDLRSQCKVSGEFEDEKAYLSEIVKQVEDDIKQDHISFMSAYLGWLDSVELGFPDLFNREFMFQILTSTGYCPDCANAYLDWFGEKKNEKGHNEHMFIITRQQSELWFMEEKFQERLKEQDM